MILRTTDEGRSWSRQKSGARKSLTSVSFADERHGIAIGAAGMILITAEGG
jgi:photosystem II stability/assembly factor-like uncharacterized protein